LYSFHFNPFVFIWNFLDSILSLFDPFFDFCTDLFLINFRYECVPKFSFQISSCLLLTDSCFASYYSSYNNFNKYFIIITVLWLLRHHKSFNVLHCHFLSHWFIDWAQFLVKILKKVTFSDFFPKKWSLVTCYEINNQVACLHFFNYKNR